MLLCLEGVCMGVKVGHGRELEGGPSPLLYTGAIFLVTLLCLFITLRYMGEFCRKHGWMSGTPVRVRPRLEVATPVEFSLQPRNANPNDIILLPLDTIGPMNSEPTEVRAMIITDEEVPSDALEI